VDYEMQTLKVWCMGAYALRAAKGLLPRNMATPSPYALAALVSNAGVRVFEMRRAQQQVVREGDVDADSIAAVFDTLSNAPP
jgi:hypothetical protein